MDERTDLKIDLARFYGRQPVGLSRDDFRKVQNDVISNSFDGGARLYQNQMKDLYEQTDGKVFVDKAEIENLRRQAELAHKYMNKFSQPPSPVREIPNEQRTFTPPTTQSQQMDVNQQSSYTPPVTQERQPNESDTNEDYFASLFKKEGDGATGQESQQQSHQAQTQAPQEPAGQQPVSSQPEHDPNTQNDIQPEQIRNEFYSQAIKRGVDPAVAIETLNSMSISDFLDWYQSNSHHKAPSPTQRVTSPEELPSLRVFNRSRPAGNEAQNTSPSPQEDLNQRGPSLHEMPEPTHPMAGYRPQKKPEHIFG